MKGRILLTPRSLRGRQGPHVRLLRDAGYEIVENPHDRLLEPQELAGLIGDLDGIILGLDRVTAEVLAAGTRLRVLSRYGVGVDNVDLEAATASGVVVTTTPGANAIAVAEHTFALLLALTRTLPLQHQWIQQGHWKRKAGRELFGGTLGIIGFGAVGREVARRAVAFGMRVLFTDPVSPPKDLIRQLVAEPRSLEELLAESDFVSLHLPFSEDTRHRIGAPELARMKPGALLVNTARGGLIDEQALYRALVDRKLAGAACDVFEREPPGENPLLKLDNFVASPHAASATEETTARMAWMAAENALAVLQGRRPTSVVNPEVFDRRK